MQARMLFLLILTIPVTVSAQFNQSYILAHLRGEFIDSHYGYKIGQLGDINGDGYSDVGVLATNPRGLLVFYGNPTPDSIPDLLLKGNLLTPMAKDVSGDGIPEIISSSDTCLYFYQGFGDSVASIATDSLVYPLPLVTALARCDIGKVGGDTLPDLVTYIANTLGGPTVLYYEDVWINVDAVSWSYHIENYSHKISGLGLIDADGDGYLDIFAGLEQRLDTTGFVYIFLGPNFSTEPDYIIGYPEGHDSLDVMEFARRVEPAGDINSDGYPDLIVGYPSPSSTSGQVRIYYGGPEADSIPDIIIANADVEGFQSEFGTDVAGLGDFNGDGIDDFAFSAVGGGSKGEVFIYSGFGPVTSVESSTDDVIVPRSLKLEQNYPNPFNPSTEIRFELPRKGEVVLDIFNVLGQRVRQLVNGPFSAGSHKVEWDGVDGNGEQVASGVYFYRLKAGEARITKKMVLLK